MNDDLRDTRRADLAERLLATRDLLADALGDDVPALTHTTLARRISADCVEMYLANVAEILGIPFLRSVVIAKSKLRDRKIEPQAEQFLGQLLTIASMATRSAENWASPEIPDDRRRFMFASLVSVHQSFVQTLAIMFDDPALDADAAELDARAKAIADEIGAVPADAA